MALCLSVPAGAGAAADDDDARASSRPHDTFSISLAALNTTCPELVNFYRYLPRLTGLRRLLGTGEEEDDGRGKVEGGGGGGAGDRGEGGPG